LPPLHPHSFPPRRSSDLSVSVAHVAPFLIEEELPALLRQGAFQDQRVQVQIRLATQGELERLQGIQLLCGRQAEVLALHPVQGLDRKSTRLNSSHGSIS